MKTNTQRRKLFITAGLSAISAGVMTMLPFKLFAHARNASKDPHSNATANVNITINPMAVKREKRK